MTDPHELQAVKYARAITAASRTAVPRFLRLWQPGGSACDQWLIDVDVRAAVFVLADRWMRVVDATEWRSMRPRVLWHTSVDWAKHSPFSSDPEAIRWFGCRVVDWLRQYRDCPVEFDDEDGPGCLFHDLAASLVRTFYGSQKLDDEFILITRATAEIVGSISYAVGATTVFAEPYDRLETGLGPGERRVSV